MKHQDKYITDAWKMTKSVKAKTQVNVIQTQMSEYSAQGCVVHVYRLPLNVQKNIDLVVAGTEQRRAE